MLNNGKLALPALLFFLTACVRLQQPTTEQRLSQSVGAPDTQEAALVSARITHLDGRRPVEPGALVIPNTANIEGEIIDRPLGSDVYVAARVPGGPWHLRAAPASIEPSGRFRSLGAPLLPGDSSIARSCQVVAVVLNGSPASLVMDDALLSKMAEKISPPVNVEIEADVKRQPEKMAITAIRGQPITPVAQAVVPLNFSLQGPSGAQMAGKKVYAVINRNGLWAVLGPPATSGASEWKIPALTLPAWAMQPPNALQLMVAASDESPPQGPQYLDVIESWSQAHSAPIQVLVRPISLNIDSLIDEHGRTLLFEDHADGSEQTLSISSDSAQISIFSDNPSSDVPVSLLVRPEGQHLWLVFGPATLAAPGQWEISSAKLNISGPGRWKICTIRAIASAEPLTGRALSDEQLQQVALGASRPRTLAFAPLGPNSQLSSESIELTYHGKERSSGPPEAIDPDDEVDISGVANLAPDSTLSKGVRCEGSQFWYFQTVPVAKNGNFRILSLPILNCPRTGAGADAEFLLVAAKVPLSGFVEDKWRLPYSVADSGAPLPIARHWLHSLMDTGKKLVPPKPAEIPAGFVPQNEVQGGISMDGLSFSLAWVLGIALLLLFAYTFRTQLWVWLNARLDAMKGQPAADSKELGPFESRIIAHYNDRILRSIRKGSARLAKLQGQFSEFAVPKPVLSKTWHLILLSLFFLGDTAFNLSAFNVFRAPMLDTFLMALPVGLGVPVCAVLMGVCIVNFSAKKRTYAVMIILLLIVVGATLYGTNIARITLLRYHSPQYLQQNPGLGTAFFVLTIFIFVATTATTILHHVHVEDKIQADARSRVQASRTEKHRGNMESIKMHILRRADAEKAKAIELICLYRTIVARHNKNVPGYFKEANAAANQWKFVDYQRLIEDIGKSPRSKGPSDPPSAGQTPQTPPIPQAHNDSKDDGQPSLAVAGSGAVTNNGANGAGPK